MPQVGLQKIHFVYKIFKDCKVKLSAPAKIEDFCLLCFTLLVFLSIPISRKQRTKYVHRNENEKAKICSFTGSERCFKVRNWAGCWGFYSLITFSGRYFSPGAWFVRLF